MNLISVRKFILALNKSDSFAVKADKTIDFELLWETVSSYINFISKKPLIADFRESYQFHLFECKLSPDEDIMVFENNKGLVDTIKTEDILKCKTYEELLYKFGSKISFKLSKYAVSIIEVKKDEITGCEGGFCVLKSTCSRYISNCKNKFLTIPFNEKTQKCDYYTK